MKSFLGLPVPLLIFLFDLPISDAATLATTRTVTGTVTVTSYANTSRSGSVTQGSGSAYASSCNSAQLSYDSYASSWTKAHANVSTTIVPQGGRRVEDVTYYVNATTLCDGHPRVTYSPAIPISTATVTTSLPITATSTYVDTFFSGSPPLPSPTCSIAPKDCDPFWRDYTKTLQQWQKQNATHPMTAAPPHAPFCMNSTASEQLSSAESAIRGCGDCTIYGDGVELLFFPPPATVHRDMCAHTQSGTLTHYGTDDVITAWHGKSTGPVTASASANGAEVITYDGHVFTDGTAYISISSVWAVDRCSKNVGTTLHDAVLAMRSQDVLSLRYSQNHFQALMSTDQQTGYPVSYADFRNPIPYSAWIGQTICDGPWDDYKCGVVYENNFRPQLAIPPGIKKLDPKWSTCQMYFRGLYDPPVALERVSTIAGPKQPGGKAIPTPVDGTQTTPALKQPSDGVTTPAQPASKYVQPTPTQQAEMGPTSTSASSPPNGPNNAPGPSPEGASTPKNKHRRVRTRIGVNWAAQASSGPKTVTQPITILEQHVIIITIIQQSINSPVTIECKDLGLNTVLPVGGACTANVPPSLGGQPSGSQPENVVFQVSNDHVDVQYDNDNGDASGNGGSGTSGGSGGNGSGQGETEGGSNDAGSSGQGTSGNAPSSNNNPSGNGSSSGGSGSSTGSEGNNGSGTGSGPGGSNGSGTASGSGGDNEGSGTSGSSPSPGSNTVPVGGSSASSGQGPTSSVTPQRGGASKQYAWFNALTAVFCSAFYTLL